MPDLSEMLDLLPEEGTPEFAFAVAERLANFSEQRDGLAVVMNDLAAPSSRRFKACYVLATMTWRDKDFGKYNDIVRYGSSAFPDSALIRTLQAQSIMGPCDDEHELLDALDLVREAVTRAPRDPGSKHLLAEIIAALGELSRAGTALLREGEISIREAKRLSARAPYPKYFATHARLLILLGKWSEARRQIAEAIDREPSTGSHYAIRIGDYQDIRAQISFAEKSAELATQQESIRRQQEEGLTQLESMRGEVVQLLGLLAAVIAFVVAGTNIARGYKFADAAALIGLLGATIVIVFALFSLNFGRGKSLRPPVATVGAGFLVAAGVIAMHAWL